MNRSEIRKTDWRTKHGHANSRLYQTWQDMKQRCYNPKLRNYKHYGERGISVCIEWRNSFEEFSNWATQNGYNDHLVLDRINNDGNYQPDNCQFITPDENKRKTRKSRYLTINGVCKIVSEWAREYGIKKEVLLGRLKRGWTEIDAVTRPVNKYCKTERYYQQKHLKINK